jgi:hypothetical protein
MVDKSLEKAGSSEWRPPAKFILKVVSYALSSIAVQALIDDNKNINKIA